MDHRHGRGGIDSQSAGTGIRLPTWLKYLVIEENDYSEADLARLKNLIAAVIRFEHPKNDAALIDLIDWLDGKPELKCIFAIWMRAVLLRQSKRTYGIT